MRTEETIQRNEAIDSMLKEFLPNEYDKDWSLLMPAYEHIQSLGYYGTIEKLYTSGMRVWFSQNGVKYLNGARDKDLKTAIWMAVSEFAMDFNKKKDGN
jgi:hypothetical protein